MTSTMSNTRTRAWVWVDRTWVWVALAVLAALALTPVRAQAQEPHPNTQATDTQSLWLNLYYFSCSEIGVEVNTAQAPTWYFTAIEERTASVAVKVRNGYSTWVYLTLFSLETTGDNWITLEPWWDPTDAPGRYYPESLTVTDGQGNTIVMHFGEASSDAWAVTCGEVPTRKIFLPIVF